MELVHRPIFSAAISAGRAQVYILIAISHPFRRTTEAGSKQISKQMPSWINDHLAVKRMNTRNPCSAFSRQKRSWKAKVSSWTAINPMAHVRPRDIVHDNPTLARFFSSSRFPKNESKKDFRGGSHLSPPIAIMA